MTNQEQAAKESAYKQELREWITIVSWQCDWDDETPFDYINDTQQAALAWMKFLCLDIGTGNNLILEAKELMDLAYDECDSDEDTRELVHRTILSFLVEAMKEEIEEDFRNEQAKMRQAEHDERSQQEKRTFARNRGM
jgi:hypothetical protein